MTEPWSVLTTRYGSDVNCPTAKQIVAAVGEVTDPAHTDDEEHVEVYLRHGYDNGPMYIVGYTTSGRMYFEQWNDQDFESEIAPRVSIAEVSPSEAIRTLQELSVGDIQLVKQLDWS